MNTALKTIAAITILTLASLGICLLGKDDAIFNQHSRIADAESNKGKSNASKSHEATPVVRFHNGNRTNEQPANNHEGNNKSHSEPFWGMKAGDWIALTLGLVAMIFSYVGLRQNRISNEKQNRAYVTVTSCEVTKTRNGLAAKVSIENLGATPAYEMCNTNWFGCCDSYKGKLPHEGNISIISKNMMLGPNDKKQVSVMMEGRNMPQEMLEKLNSGGWSLLLDGKITYQDEFGKRHSVEYYFRAKKPILGQMNFGERGIKYTRV